LLRDYSGASNSVDWGRRLMAWKESQRKEDEEERQRGKGRRGPREGLVGKEFQRVEGEGRHKVER